MGNTIVKDGISSIVDKYGISSVQAAEKSEKGDKPKCKACCACPETKKIRDACIIEKGEENCGPLIEAHKQCMRDMGFKI